MKVTLGQKYRDAATGYEGTATARTERFGADPSVCLSRLNNSGSIEDTWVAEGRCEPTEATKDALGFR